MIVTCPHCHKAFSTGTQTPMSDARAKTGLTIQEMADKSGVSQWTMSRIERGLALPPRLDVARKIAAAYQSTIDELWPSTDELDAEDIEEPEETV